MILFLKGVSLSIAFQRQILV